MKNYSTRAVARKLGLHFTTFHRYLASKKVQPPPMKRVAGVRVRLWSQADIERVRKLLPKIANGRKTRYQKQKDKPQAKSKRSVPKKK